MKLWMFVALTAGLAGCGAISEQMDARASACAAQGGVLTGMGCQGGGAFLPGRIDTAPPIDRYGQRNYNEQGQYVGAHGTGLLVDRPSSEPGTSSAMPSNVVCVRNAAGNAASCDSQ